MSESTFMTLQEITEIIATKTWILWTEQTFLMVLVLGEELIFHNELNSLIQKQVSH